MNSPHGVPAAAVQGLLERLSPRQRQFALLAAIMAGGIVLLWLIFALTGSESNGAAARQAAKSASDITNIGVMPGGQQVNSVDQWIGTAGRKLAEYESEREEQTRLNREREAFESRTMNRFAELEKKLTTAGSRPSPPASAPAPSTAMPPTASLPAPPPAPSNEAMPSDLPMAPPPPPAPPVPRINRITLVPQAASSGAAGANNASKKASEARTVSTFLPVSFTRGTLLGGLDAPTGGQSQANPHPVLIRLSDNSVLPNRFRATYRECFVVAAGYGDISSERAYLRTESLSCVRRDGATLEVRIQGSIYGEDGKVGMRGRLVTKQGQMLANALLAGVVSGIGQGLSTSSSQYSTSAFGSVATTSGSEAYRAGVGRGVGRSLDRLAEYYIKLAENTFPVIEVDAGREIDVVITKGVRIDIPINDGTGDGRHAGGAPEDRYMEVSDDTAY